MWMEIGTAFYRALRRSGPEALAEWPGSSPSGSEAVAGIEAASRLSWRLLP